MQKKSLSQELREWVKKSGIRQNDIAGELGVSAAAVSQFLHGQTLPTPEHFDRLLSMLSVDAATSRRLRELWMLCRAVPAAEGESELNHNLFLLRAKRGFSLEQTAWQTGLSEKRLFRLEKDPKAKLTKKEREIFICCFGCSPDDEFFSLSNELTRKEVVQIAENASFGLPVISLDSLKQYQPSYPLSEFAMTCRKDFLPERKDFCVEPVLVTASCEELNFPHRGQLRILLSRQRPKGFLPLDLCLFPGGLFRLRQGGSEAAAFLPLSEAKPEEKLGDPLWKIPVAEVTLLPLKLE